MDTERFIEADAHVGKPSRVDLIVETGFSLAEPKQASCQFLKGGKSRLCEGAKGGNARKAARHFRRVPVKRQKNLQTA
ncbi:hypothetical protein [Pseudomonas agarici]|uniref:hypothetical protein n=1 Tax=Pseudomonas agarici TaxID=46677 RepID=UPI0012E38A1F|nr:hypothetical protein [Pseudomonas agarici]NWB92063.1 hypothetical protein [Pseudomonas agarici]NWC09892.1 hypothetical protein [Pseudomonas agarici]